MASCTMNVTVMAKRKGHDLHIMINDELTVLPLTEHLKTKYVMTDEQIDQFLKLLDEEDAKGTDAFIETPLAIPLELPDWARKA